jgi:hypothetical protein
MDKAFCFIYEIFSCLSLIGWVLCRCVEESCEEWERICGTVVEKDANSVFRLQLLSFFQCYVYILLILQVSTISQYV